MKTAVRTDGSRGFTLVELMIVVAIIALLALMALPAFARARRTTFQNCCRNNQRHIFDCIVRYAMDNAGVTLTTTDWPNLCAARDRLAPGGQEDYLRDWDVFECPVVDAQDQHDYAYVFQNGEMVDVICNNNSATVRALHNAD